MILLQSEELQVANQRWLATFSVLLSQLLVGVDEERVLARIVHLNLDAGRRLDVDPLNAASTTDQPQVIFARSIFVFPQIKHQVLTYLLQTFV